MAQSQQTSTESARRILRKTVPLYPEVLLKAAEAAVAKWKFASGGESREIIEVRFAP
jgi:hypothetical protein